jgi:hypothetical protein
MSEQSKKKSFLGQLSAIASIVSAAIICIRLAYYGILSVETAAFIMIVVVALVAIGHVITKLGICAIAICLFAKFMSHGNEILFQNAIVAIILIMATLIGTYFILKGLFQNK